MPKSILPLVLAAVTAGAPSALRRPTGNNQPQYKDATEMADHSYIGMWVTKDGQIRQELLPNSRYDEARASRRSAYQGRYEIRGNKIYYWDDTGFTADGEFIDGVLHHGGMLFYREGQVKRNP
ncbi:Atu4866 domain-containing protein [Microvirga pakistanensis]|uniref:Atu4866 domain-containing protein n=1 Tax=Microvirga pakistanensis TaxID=1682650 RepID=UPI0010694579|nr:Atu4866 domain-containing protein [Microvirga pakistanensis]